MAMKAINTRGEKRVEQVFPADYINSALKKDFQEFLEFSSGKAERTIEEQNKKIMQFLGWLHRERDVPLENLRLESIVHRSELIANPLDYLPDKSKSISVETIDPTILQQLLLKRFILKEEAEQTAAQNLTQINSYLSWLGGVPITKVSYIDVFISVAHFIYKDIIGKGDHQESKSIPVIRELLRLKVKYQKESANHPESVPFHLRSVPWEKCIETVEKLRLRYEQKYTNYRSKRVRKKFERKRRTSGALATDLQNFLSVAFMVLMPPDRSRTYCEIELGRTLIFGKVEGRSIIPAHKLDDPSLARWYVFLEARDYKTGKRYGLYIAPVPNVEFPGGKTLYTYIDEWLNWGRESHKLVDHNYFFRGVSACDPLNYRDWSIRINELFGRETGVSVPPKELRKIFISYLKSQKVSRAELEAASVAQHHSQKMQDQVYDYQEQQEKLQPIFDFSEQVVDKVLKNFSSEKTVPTPAPVDQRSKEDLQEYQNKLEELQQEFDTNTYAVNQVLKQVSFSGVELNPTLLDEPESSKPKKSSVDKTSKRTSEKGRLKRSNEGLSVDNSTKEAVAQLSAPTSQVSSKRSALKELKPSKCEEPEQLFLF